MTAEVISYLLSQENEKEYLQSQMVLLSLSFSEKDKDSRYVLCEVL